MAGQMGWKIDHLSPRQACGAVLAALAVVACGSGPAVSPARAETFIIQGSTTFNRVIMERHEELIEATSGHDLTIIPNKTAPGLIALLEGRAHLAMISAPLEREVEVLRRSLPGWPYDRLRAHEILTTHIAIGVNRSNPVRYLAMASIKQMVRGTITNWKDVGGLDRPVRVVMAGGGGAMTVAESELLGGHPKLDHIIYVKTPVNLVQVIEQEPGALGFAQLPLAKQRGIPELATDRPLETKLSIVTLGEPTPAMKTVIDAIREIVKSTM